MKALAALTPRTRRRHANSTKPPVLVRLESVSLCYPQGGTAIRDLSFRIRGGETWRVFSDDNRINANLLKCISGLQSPEIGTVKIWGHVSWPMGQVAGISDKLSCEANSRFFASVYGQGEEEELHLMRQLCDFDGKHWNHPFSELSADAKQQFKLALSLVLDFDLYVMDPATLLGLHRRGAWTDHWQGLLQRRLKERAIITLGHDKFGVSDQCKKGLILRKGRIEFIGPLERCQVLWSEGEKEDCLGV